MSLEVIGPHPFERDVKGQQITRIGTVFPDYSCLYTQLPAVHAWQRLGFIARLNSLRTEENKPPLTPEEEQTICANSVDLIFEADHILIRPVPERMDLAFAADELLQSLVSKRQVNFLSISDPRVREALKRRGEFWRMSDLPKTQPGREQRISGSKVGIDGLPIYFYNRLTGTRWLTAQEFENLGKLDDAKLARHLDEIGDHARRLNRLDRPEVDFFAADLVKFGLRDFAGISFDKLPAEELRARYEELKGRFRAAVHEGLRADEYKNKGWCERMLSTLFLEGNEAQTEHILAGLSPEFFLQIEWLPGGRFEEGEFLFDSVFNEAADHPDNPALQSLCDERARGIIFNFVREHGDLEYINIGRVPEPLSLNRPQRRGRRGVYIAELQSRSEPNPIRRFMRLQKWGVWEHLDEGMDLLASIEQSDDYTDYWLDRRLACRQLGMNLTRRVVMRRLTEIYTGTNNNHRGRLIRTTYFERDYLAGIATDKLPGENYAKPAYALKLALLLGKAAASSMIVGRSLEQGTRPVFDDGDEVVIEGPDGLPVDLLLGDHSGAFGEFKLPVETFAAHYARPINARAGFLRDPVEFANTYMQAFTIQFAHIQSDYRKRRRAFDTLFKHCKYDTGGSLAYRWERVLHRLDEAKVEKVVEAVRQHIKVLNQ